MNKRRLLLILFQVKNKERVECSPIKEICIEKDTFKKVSEYTVRSQVMKEIMYEDYNNNIQFIKDIFQKIALMVENELMWSISDLDVMPVNSEDYSGVGGPVNNRRQRVYLFQQRILDEHTVVIGHKELMNLFDDMRTIYDGVFVTVIDGHQSKISIFDGDIISIQGDIEEFL